MGWVGTWTTTPAPVESVALANQTLRMVAHVSVGGSRLRVRFSNAYGLRRLSIGAARVGLRGRAADIEAGSVWINDAHQINCQVPFGGYKQSGLGREWGSFGLEEFLQHKAIQWSVR